MDHTQRKMGGRGEDINRERVGMMTSQAKEEERRGCYGEKMQARLAPQKGVHFTLQRKPNQMQNEIYIAIVSNSLETSDSVM